MSKAENSEELHYGSARVRIYPSSTVLGVAAAELAAKLIREVIENYGRARIVVATGNSQIPLMDALTDQPVDWKAVEVFHMDEYSGMKETNPASFRYWIKTHLEDKVNPGKLHYIAGDAPDLDAEMKRYSKLLDQAPIDLAFVGFGENGHIAFNDPPSADFDDPMIVKRVHLDEACRRQQAGEGHFTDFASVPLEAVTITCTGLFRAHAWICCVPEARKANAVRDALEGPISVSCPASMVQRHPNAYVYLDQESAALLSAAVMDGGSETRAAVNPTS